MKTNLMIAAMAALVGFTACSKKDDPGKISEEKANVLVKIQPQGSRVEAEDIGAAGLTLGPGHLFFATNSGTITRHITILASGAAGDDQKNVADFATGATIVNVPNNSGKCYLLSNATVTMPGAPIVGRNISDIKDLSLDVSDMDDPTAGVVNVPLWGEGNVTGTTSLTTTVLTSAIGSRIQIAKFTGGADVVTYSIDGIFINNYFNNMKVDKSVVTTAIVNNQSDASRYIGGGSNYPGTLPLYDYDAVSKIGTYTSATKVTEPKNTGGTPFTTPVWAYNVFPNEQPAGTADKADFVPHIIVRLSGVQVTRNSATVTLSDPQFITIKGMNDGAPVDNLVGGHVYTFRDIPFSADDITDVPEVKSIDATVDITMVPWIEVDVEPIL